MIGDAQDQEAKTTILERVTPGGDITDSGNTTDDAPRILARQIVSSTSRGRQQLGSSNVVSDSGNRWIEVSDDDDTRVIMGNIGGGNWGMKVSRPGVDVTTANDSDLIFNSQQNIFKIIKTVFYTLDLSTITTAYVADITIPHGLTNLVPQVTGSFTNTSNSTIQILPWLYYAPGVSYFAPASPGPSAAVVIDSVDTTNIYIRVRVMDASGLTPFTVTGKLLFKLSCLQESAGGSV